MKICYTLKKGSSRVINLEDISEVMRDRSQYGNDLRKTEHFLSVCHDLAEVNNCSVVFYVDELYDLVEEEMKMAISAKFTKKR